MASRNSENAAVERALERLFRLSMGRREQALQSAAVGVEVTRAGYAVLRSLDDAGHSTMGELARTCAMDPASAARQVQALVDHGLVERAPGESDRRVSIVRLTPEGRRAYRKIVELRIRIMDEVLAEWPVAEREQLAALVERLVDDLATRGARGARAAQAGAA